MSRLETFLGACLFAMVVAASQVHACVGDCDSDGQVEVAEIILGIRAALGRADPASVCPQLDANADGKISISELLLSVRAALGECPTPSIPPTVPIFPSNTVGATNTPTPVAAETATTTSTATPGSNATETPGVLCHVSVDEDVFPVTGCGPVGERSGRFTILMSPESCCWVSETSGRIDYSPAHGCGGAVVDFTVKKNPLPEGITRTVSVFSPSRDVLQSSESIFFPQSGSCTRTPTPRFGSRSLAPTIDR